ncbi:MAG: Mu transposase C-terminal domain-containing protein [Myxacorys californica WJT36-NPBG1]|jgi:putative transposase|nr:Mu transposase C-terminal domain-containing protein [Myxacorys californica WJT36-NPBG1]
MNPPEANEYSDQQDDGDFSLIYEEEDLGTEEPSVASEIEELASDKSKTIFQPSEQSIACYGAPVNDVAAEFLDRRYALEDEITLQNGEKVKLQLTDEQKLKREVIRNLLEARHNRTLFSERLKEGAEKLNLSTRQVRRIFKDWIALGTASLQRAARKDDGKPRRSEYWYDLSRKIYEDGNKGDRSMTRTQAASRVEDQIYEYMKLELPSEAARLEAAGFSGEKLDLELSRVIEQRQKSCNQEKREIQQEISALKTKISELRKRKLDTGAVHDRIKRLEEQKQAIVAFEFWREYGQPPSTRTVEIWLKPIEEKNHKAKTSRSPGWHGDTLILRTRDGESISVTRSNQVWQIDHTKADVLLVDEDGVEIGRPVLTTVIDCYARCIVGYRLGLKAPSSLVVALALRHAMLPKQYGPEYEIGCQWITHGSPRYIYTDGAADFNFLEYVGDQLGFKAKRREQPSQGGIVERPFRTLSELLSEAPGYTGPNVQKRPKDVAKVVKMTLRELDMMLAGYLADNYNQNPDPRTRANPFVKEQSRIARWEAGLKTPPTVIKPRELDVCLMQTDERVVYDGGYVKFENLLYKGENLGRHTGDTVFLKFDPRDITMLLVYSRRDGREKFIARGYAVGLEADQFSLEEVTHSAKKLRKESKSINNVAIREEIIRRRKRFASKKNITKKDRRNAEEVKVNPPPKRYEEDQHKRVSKPPVEEQSRPVEILIPQFESVINSDDEDEDYAIEVDD